MVKKINSQNFEETLRENEIVLVDFYADWCGPCKMMSPILEEISEEREDIVIGKLNVDDSYDIASKYGIISIPTLIVFKNCKKVVSSVGFRNKKDVVEMIDAVK